MRQFKIYLDLDQVITNFDQAVQDLGPCPSAGLAPNATPEDRQTMYDAIEQAGERFWSQMGWAPGGKELWAWLKQFNPVLLSSPGKFRWSESGKKQWVADNIPGTPLFLSEDKWAFAQPNSILIDDMEDNIGAWEGFGGIGVLHKGDVAATKEKVLAAIRGISPSRAEEVYMLDMMKGVVQGHISLACVLRKIEAFISRNDLLGY